MATKKAPKAVTTFTPAEVDKTPEPVIETATVIESMPDVWGKDIEDTRDDSDDSDDFENFRSADGHIDPLTQEITIAPIFGWGEGETGQEYQERCREAIHDLTRFVPAIDREVQRLQAEILYTQRELDAQEKRALNRVER